jgi:hypothetical protein
VRPENQDAAAADADFGFTLTFTLANGEQTEIIFDPAASDTLKAGSIPTGWAFQTRTRSCPPSSEQGPHR